MPGSNGKVLKNLLGIATQEEIERVETELLFEVSDQLLDELSRGDNRDVYAFMRLRIETQ
jgi:hypothetical protein